MRLLGISFGILELFGFWRPIGLSGWKANLYNFYTIINVLILYLLAFTQFIDLTQSLNNIGEFMNNALIMVTIMNSCAKVGNILRRRDEISSLINILHTEPCCPRDDIERRIQNQFDNAIRRNSLKYAVFTEVVVCGVIISSVLKDAPHRRLAFKAWLPYSYDTEFLYWMTYIHQFIASTIGSFVNISYDTLIPGCMVQICGQFEIFNYRLARLCKIRCDSNLHCSLSQAHTQQKIEIIEQKIISQSVEHQSKIFEFAESANGIFTYTIFFQYSVSFVVICASIYSLSILTPFTPEFMSIIAYCLCMLTQIYIFCYYGSVVMNKSIDVSNAIYAMDWVALGIPTKKSLVTMMIRTLKPIRFTSGYVVVLSLNSLNGLLKLSYSAYNVLNSTS